MPNNDTFKQILKRNVLSFLDALKKEFGDDTIKILADLRQRIKAVFTLRTKEIDDAFGLL